MVAFSRPSHTFISWNSMTSGISSTAFSHVLNSARRSSSADLFFLPIEVPFTDTVFLGKSRLTTGLPNSLMSWAAPQRRTVPVRKTQEQLRVFYAGGAGAGLTRFRSLSKWEYRRLTMETGSLMAWVADTLRLSNTSTL